MVGEHVSVVQVDGTGRVALLRASSWNISGSADPRSWRYDVSLSGPTGTHTRVVPADGVVHVRYLPDNRAPWRGVAPWKRAPTLSKLAAEVEAALVREVRLPVKIIIPMPQGGGIRTSLNRNSPAAAVGNLRCLKCGCSSRKRRPQTLTTWNCLSRGGRTCGGCSRG